MQGGFVEPAATARSLAWNHGSISVLPDVDLVGFRRTERVSQHRGEAPKVDHRGDPGDLSYGAI